MDSLITAAARAIDKGDVLGALNRVALRDDPPALALRGIATARHLVRAKALLRSTARAFAPKEAVARARCVVAKAEIALVSRPGLAGEGARCSAGDARNARLADPPDDAAGHLVACRFALRILPALYTPTTRLTRATVTCIPLCEAVADQRTFRSPNAPPSKSRSPEMRQSMRL
jgi:hypothetical protein